MVAPQPPEPPGVPPTSTRRWSGLFRRSPLQLCPAGPYATPYAHLWWGCWIRLSLSVCTPLTAPSFSPPLSASDLVGPLSVWHLSLYCQASGGSHLKITLPGHTQASLNACQFTHGKRITRLLLGSRKLLLMAKQIIRVHLVLPANRFFMRVHS